MGLAASGGKKTGNLLPKKPKPGKTPKLSVGIDIPDQNPGIPTLPGGLWPTGIPNIPKKTGAREDPVGIPGLDPKYPKKKMGSREVSIGIPALDPKYPKKTPGSREAPVGILALDLDLIPNSDLDLIPNLNLDLETWIWIEFQIQTRI